MFEYYMQTGITMQCRLFKVFLSTILNVENKNVIIIIISTESVQLTSVYGRLAEKIDFIDWKNIFAETNRRVR